MSTTLNKLGCEKRSQLKIAVNSDSTVTIVYAGYIYSADREQFNLLNFECPITLEDIERR